MANDEKVLTRTLVMYMEGLFIILQCFINYKGRRYDTGNPYLFWKKNVELFRLYLLFKLPFSNYSLLDLYVQVYFSQRIIIHYIIYCVTLFIYHSVYECILMLFKVCFNVWEFQF